MKSPQILYLGNKLTRHGNTPTTVEILGPAISGLGYKVESKSSVKNSFFRLMDMLFAVVKRRRSDPVVLIDTYSTTAFWFAYTAALVCDFFRLKYIPILHGGELPSRLDRSPGMSKKLFGNSYANVAVSAYLEHEFHSRNFRTILIHNHIHISMYPFIQRKQLRPKLLWVRAFRQLYNPQMAIDIMQRLTRHFPEAELCMVGPDTDNILEDFRSYAEAMNVKVTFPGRLTKEQWITLSEDYDIFLNTTNIDNTPVSVMEAMALGLPVVSTNAGGLPFLINNGSDGILVEKNSPDEATTAIIMLLTNPAAAEYISKTARKRAEEWDWSRTGAQWKKLIDSVNGTQHESE